MCEWKRIADYPRYFISDSGVIRNAAGKDLKPRPNKGGYFLVTLYKEGGEKATCYIHHIVATTFIGERPAGYVINHRDGNRTNNALWNLEYCTQRENVIDMYRRLSRTGNRFSKTLDRVINQISRSEF